jgi:hypothetical protein
MLSLLDMAKSNCFKEKFHGRRGIVRECQGIPDYPVPGSSLIFEVSRKGENYFVRTLYNGVAFTICGGSHYCKFEEFQKLMKSKVHLPNGIFEQCMNQRRSMTIITEHKQKIYKDNWINASLSLLLAIQIAAILFTCGYWRKKQAATALSLALKKDGKKLKDPNEKWSLNTDTQGNDAP